MVSNSVKWFYADRTDFLDSAAIFLWTAQALPFTILYARNILILVAQSKQEYDTLVVVSTMRNDDKRCVLGCDESDNIM